MQGYDEFDDFFDDEVVEEPQGEKRKLSSEARERINRVMLVIVTVVCIVNVAFMVNFYVKYGEKTDVQPVVMANGELKRNYDSLYVAQGSTEASTTAQSTATNQAVGSTIGGDLSPGSQALTPTGGVSSSESKSTNANNLTDSTSAQSTDIQNPSGNITTEQPTTSKNTTDNNATNQPTTVKSTSNISTTTPPTTAQNSAQSNGGATVSTPASTAVETTKSDKININTATADELTALNGIGEVKAKAIIEYRNENGNFKTIEDITNVSGIGEKTLEKNRAIMTVD